MTEWTTVFCYFVVPSLLIVGGYYGRRMVKKAAKALAELFLFLWLFNGDSIYHHAKRSQRMYTFNCETQYLDEVTMEELYNFLTPSVQSEIGNREVTTAMLQKVILTYSNILLFRDKMDGSLRGITLVGFHRNKEYTFMKIGLAFITNFYKGAPNLYTGLGYYTLRELLLHPFTPFYVVGKAFGYKSYLVAMKFRESYPRHDKETPPHFKALFKEFVDSVKAKSDVYDEETFVLKQERSHLRENLLAVSEQDLKNPDIKYFVEQNPGYLQGHCLVCGYKLSWYDLFSTVLWQIVKSSMSKKSKTQPDGPRRQNSQKPSRPRLLRRLTFQEQSANSYAVNMYEMDMAGEPVISPSNNYAFHFSPTHESAEVPEFDLGNL